MWRLHSSAKSDQSFLCAHLIAKDLGFLHMGSEDGSDWLDAQNDLSLCWAQPPCWFSYDASHSS